MWHFARSSFEYRVIDMGGSFAKNNPSLEQVKHLQQSKSMLNGEIPTSSNKNTHKTEAE